MFDWQVEEAENTATTPTREGGRPLLRWWLLAGGLLLLLAGGAVRWRLGEQEALLRAELRETIGVEERARLFGLREEAERLVVPNAPAEWQQGFEASFARPGEEVVPLSLVVEEARLWGAGGAVVRVRVGEAVQLRHYRLVDDGWRRAPLPEAVWGESRTIRAAGGIEVAFRARDEAFARGLARDLPALLGEISEWGEPAKLPVIEVRPSEFRTGPARRVRGAADAQLAADDAHDTGAGWGKPGPPRARTRGDLERLPPGRAPRTGRHAPPALGSGRARCGALGARAGSDGAAARRVARPCRGGVAVAALCPLPLPPAGLSV